MKNTFFSIALAVILLCRVPTFADTPNVVMIISDDQAWTDFGFMGHKEIKTPHLDRLASQSAVFTHGYVPSSLCRPSLATMITGLYPHQNLITGNDPPKNTDRALMLKHIKNATTLPRLLASRGYQSLQTGKWWEGEYTLGGFTHGMTHGDPQRRGRHGDQGLTIGRQGLKPIFDFIENRGDSPFFIWYAPFLPHSPHNPPQRLLAKYQKPGRSEHIAKYYAMCQWFDETCGQLLKYLDDKKLSENTLVVFVTDNGWIQDPLSRRYALKSKRSPYDGGIRTPIMLRWPGKIKAAQYNDLAISTDLVPTILSACDLPTTEEMSGINLLDICRGKKNQRSAIFGEIFEHDVADIDDPQASLLYRWCIQGSHKLILPKSGRLPELYDLQSDPYETKNLSASKPELVQRLTKKIDQWWSLD